ncbi:apolipoprotein N-acyltransferase [Oceanibacterium hippocampi]|uniref:Apolipoprotein N-acyltransferase n=1 Tax=Oceanibacterium hippocampi TaxID=745714 RepID=A0A1Y5RJU4_9PROT|nr:apolipoprotein N-acyltransferase [Oceanibacterium hippocampi]SLN19252.1 Apolipoprotein N-acyltransferase [Oceanibacterium hippocampi]
MTALAERLGRLGGWRRYGLAYLLGALAALGFAPLYLVPVLPVAFTGLCWLLAGSRGRRAAFLVGWWFGLGHFMLSLYWIGFAFVVDIARHGFLLPLPLIGFPAILAIFPGLALLGARMIAPDRRWQPFALAATWTLAELVRAHIFTGFPWNQIGQVWAFSPVMMQVAALSGVYALGFATVWAAAAPAALAGTSDSGSSGRALPVAALLPPVLLGIGIAVFGLVRLDGAEIAAEAEAPRLRIVQANIDQKLKWQADLRARHVERLIELSGRPSERPIDYLVWPETALPYFLDREPALRQLLGRMVGPDRYLLTGTPRFFRDAEGDHYRNSVEVLTGDGEIGATYDKQHLVPFGEYLPFRSLLTTLGLGKIVQGVSGNADFGPGGGDGILRVAGLPPVRALICYEAIFPEMLAGDHDAAWLLNVTNDAWFGHTAGPYQHLAQARFRAVEQGLPMVRAANTGISAFIDSHGRVLSSLGLGEGGVLDGALPPPLAGVTPYRRFGDVIPLVLLLAAAAVAALGARLGRHARPADRRA